MPVNNTYLTLFYVYSTYLNSSTHIHEDHNEVVGVEFSVYDDEQNKEFPNTEA